MPKTTMQAIRYHDYGGPEVLVLEEVPRPQPEAGQVLVRVLAAGVNPADWKKRAGLYKAYGPSPMPSTPGMEGAGVIEAVGPDVSTFQVGQEVYGILIGSYAEYALAAASDIQPKPAELTFEQAASVPVGALTAWGAVVEAANLQAGQRVLVHGAAGGVGLYVVQLAVWKGAQVIGTASAHNLDFVRSLGAELVLDYNAAPFETLVHDLDAVIDTVGGDIPERSFKVLRPDGVFVTVAARLAPDAGKAEGVRAMSAGRAKPENLARLSELIEAGKLTPVVGPVFPLADASKAHELSETGHGRGRILLKMD
jgi:NADPH:quinone reductase-like Zn-dependent oxidoreductase